MDPKLYDVIGENLLKSLQVQLGSKATKEVEEMAMKQVKVKEKKR